MLNITNRRIIIKKNKAGFTLIELLAVIVILAIIALIATPIVMNIISDAKISANERSAENYERAINLAISKSIMNLENIEDGIYHIDKDGNLVYKNKKIKLDIDKPTFEMMSVSIKDKKIESMNFIKDNYSYGIDKEANQIKVWDGTYAEPSQDDDGNYLINSPEELAWIAEQVNNNSITFEGKTILLMNDIDLGGEVDSEGNATGRQWNPIGDLDNGKYFKGTFDGNNHIIQNIYVDDKYAGLFEIVWCGTIKNLNIYKSYIKGNMCAGGILGLGSSSTISNLNVYDSKIISSQKSGGIVGELSKTTAQYLNSYTNYIKGNDLIGGVIGQSLQNNLRDLYSNSIVDNSESIDHLAQVGGVIGKIGSNKSNTSTIVDGIISEAKVTASSDAGGVFGHIQIVADATLNIENVVSYAEVTGISNIGGVIGVICGYPAGTNIYLNNIKSFATINGTGECIGGVIGNISQGNNNNLTNIYSKANITGNTKVGGIIGGINTSDTTVYYKNIESESIILGTPSDSILGYNKGGSFINMDE